MKSIKKEKKEIKIKIKPAKKDHKFVKKENKINYITH